MPANIYSAVYSGVPVYEFMCRGIAVMRRREDSFLNATQILKVAGIEKGQRTKILEREVLPGQHEKVQGGYGKYQGTWVPFARGKDLARQYRVEPYLRALFDFVIPQEDLDRATPAQGTPGLPQRNREIAKPRASASPRMKPAGRRARSSSVRANGPQSIRASLTPSPLLASFHTLSPSVPPSVPPSPPWRSETPARKRARAISPLFGNHLDSIFVEKSEENYRDPWSASRLKTPKEETIQGTEKYRSALVSAFVNDDGEAIPDLLTRPILPPDLDIDMLVDDQGHTALHWAAALARIPLLEVLVRRHSNIRHVNHNGETALIRAILVTNNYDRQSFPRLLKILHPTIPIADQKNQTVLHRIAIMAGVRGRKTSSHYYMECLLEWIAWNGGDFSSIVDTQDKNGDTALTLAARIGDRYLAKFLMDIGANRDIENKAGLKADDFGVDDSLAAPVELKPFIARNHSVPSNGDVGPAKDPPANRKSKDVMMVVQRMVDELDGEFFQELEARKEQIQDTRIQLRQATKDLAETRRKVVQCQGDAHHLTEALQRIKNLELSVEEETERSRRSYFTEAQLQEDTDQHFAVQRPSTGESDLWGPGVDPMRGRRLEQEVVLLRARVKAYERNDNELTQQLSGMRDKALVKELQCKRVIALCCKIPFEKVDQLLAPLTVAVESDGAGLDLGRVAEFMSRVKQQEGMASAGTPLNR